MKKFEGKFGGPVDLRSLLMNLAGQAESKMQTIRLVDDDRSILIARKRILELLGYRVETSSVARPL